MPLAPSPLVLPSSVLLPLPPIPVSFVLTVVLCLSLTFFLSALATALVRALTFSLFALCFSRFSLLGSLVSVMTYNVWNFDNGPQWERRVDAVSALIRTCGADAIGLQEVRRRVPDNGRQFEFQLRDILNNTGDIYPYWHFESATYYEQERSEEGLTLLSRWPMEDIRVKELPYGVSDANRRLVLRYVTRDVCSAIDSYTLSHGTSFWLVSPLHASFSFWS